MKQSSEEATVEWPDGSLILLVGPSGAGKSSWAAGRFEEHEVLESDAFRASGPNAASPHHDPADRVIEHDEVVLFDFGGTMRADGAAAGYCSDITRCLYTGEPPGEFRELYRSLQVAQAAAVEAATVGTPCEDVDGVARRLITEAGYGGHFIHRTGHGIGLEAHEDPYIVGGNCDPLVPGNAFSVEPGIYIAGQWGARIEDIVVATDEGPEPLNRVSHDLTLVAR